MGRIIFDNGPSLLVFLLCIGQRARNEQARYNLRERIVY